MFLMCPKLYKTAASRSWSYQSIILYPTVKGGFVMQEQLLLLLAETQKRLCCPRKQNENIYLSGWYHM